MLILKLCSLVFQSRTDLFKNSASCLVFEKIFFSLSLISVTNISNQVNINCLFSLFTWFRNLVSSSFLLVIITHATFTHTNEFIKFIFSYNSFKNFFHGLSIELCFLNILLVKNSFKCSESSSLYFHMILLAISQ
jgi:hypothetical protein